MRETEVKLVMFLAPQYITIRSRWWGIEIVIIIIFLIPKIYFPLFYLASLNSCLRKHSVCIHGFHLKYLNKYTTFPLYVRDLEVDSRLIILPYLLYAQFIKMRMKVL